jgi:hypothetical protein
LGYRAPSAVPPTLLGVTNPVSTPPQSLAIPGAPGASGDLLHRVVTAMFEIVEDVAPVIARQMHKRIPALGSLEDEAAVEATRRSALGSMYELLCITRAGLTDPGVIETSPEALEHVRYLRQHGAGLTAALDFYHIGLAMFEPLVAHELVRFAPDQATVAQLAGPLRAFIHTYVDQVTKRVAAEFGSEREAWVSDPDDPVWHDPDSVRAIQEYIAGLGARERLQTDEGVAARRYTEWALERFCEAMEAAADDERMSSVLARADTTVRIELADDPELGVTLLLDRDPIEITDASVPAEVELSIVSVDLARLYSPDFHLSMAIVRGRVGYVGPVRKFLRVTPVVRHASLPELRQTATLLPENDGHYV